MKLSLVLRSALVFLLGLAPLRAADPLLDLAGTDENCNAFYLAIRDYPHPADSLKDEAGRTMLQLATRAHNQHNAFILLERGADPNTRDSAGATPLHDAVTGGRRPDNQMLWELLTIRHADLNALDHEGRTPLAAAILAGNPEAVEFLLRAGAETDPTDVPDRLLPKSLAQSSQNPRMARLLDQAQQLVVKIGAAPNREPTEEEKSALLTAAAQADFPKIKALLESGVPINAQDASGRTALFRAVQSNQDSVAIHLLILGAKPDLARNDGIAPLGCITGMFGFSFDKMREALILAGADPQRDANNRWSPLAASARDGNSHGVQSSLWTGIVPTVKTAQGTLMHLASKKSRQHTMNLLRLYGVDEAPYVGDGPDWPYLDAVRRGDVALATKLLDGGQAINVADDSGESAFMQAIGWNQWETAELLFQRGANINYLNPKNGEGPLLQTCYWNSGQADSLRQRLLLAGADPNVADKSGVTPLIESVPSTGLCAALRQLLDAGANVNAADNKGRTALSIAREYKNEAVIALLLKYGAK